MRIKHSGYVETTEEDKILYHNNELFHTGTAIIAKRLRINIETPNQITVLHDILARTYLNAIDNRGLLVDVVPFFFLYLPPRLDTIEKETTSTLQLVNKVDEYTYDYIKAYFVMSIETLLEELHNLTKGFKRYKEVVLGKEEDIGWMTQYLENKLIKEKPDWWKLLDSNRIRIEVTEPLLMKTLGPDIGDELLVYRPYTIQSRRNRWEVEKEGIFVKGRKNVTGLFYLDYAKIRVHHKTIGSHGVVSIIAKDQYGDSFVCDIAPDTPHETVLCQWRVFVNMGIMGDSYSEPYEFTELKDFERLNEKCGFPLTEFKLKTLIEDASMKTAHLEV